jgi:hypothetical protein
MLLIYQDESAMATMSQEELGQIMQAYWGYEAELAAAGAKVSGEALHPSMTATVVKVRDGQTLTTDGPFAETTELIGGYYVVEANDLDEAIAWAAKIPTAAVGAIEVRPVVDFSNPQG